MDNAKGKWLLATNGRRHWFENETDKISACGSMTDDRCIGEVRPGHKNDYPCATCVRLEKQYGVLPSGH